MTLRDILDDMAESASFLAHQASRRALDYYLSHFEEKNGRKVPKKIPVELTDGIEGEALEPAMISPKGARLKDITFETETDIDFDEDKQTLGASLTRRLFRRKSPLKITARFRVEDVPEGIAIVQEQVAAYHRDALRGVKEAPVIIPAQPVTDDKGDE